MFSTVLRNISSVTPAIAHEVGIIAHANGIIQYQREKTCMPKDDILSIINIFI